MPLMPDHAKYHELGPKDIKVGGTPVMSFGIARTTNQTGEQLHVECPVYAEDSRDDVLKRMGFCYSVIQERMEDENKAVRWIDERQKIASVSLEKVKKLRVKLEEEAAELKKLAYKKSISKEEMASKIWELKKSWVEEAESLRITAAHAAHEINSGLEVDRAKFESEDWPVIKARAEEEDEINIEE